VSGPREGARRSATPADDLAARRISRLLRAERLESVAALAAGISHDLANVLAAVRMTADALGEQPRTPAAAASLAALGELADEGIGLVRQILFLARAMDGEPAPFDLRHLVAEVRRLARTLFPPPSSVVTRYPAQLWVVSGDAALVYQLLLGACRRLRRAHGPAGELRIGASNAVLDDAHRGIGPSFPPGPYVLVEVAAAGAAGPEAARAAVARRAGGASPSPALRRALAARGALFEPADLDNGVGLRVHLPAAVGAR
jgi:two-component system cell cycle sensor histidine kinase/response regulator CckA